MIEPKENSWIICKKDHLNSEEYGFIIGRSYRISRVIQNINCVYVRIKTDIANNGQWFNYDNDIDIQYLNPLPPGEYDKYIWDYFYTDKEARKLKLKKINENC
jgi:hypothetical protein